MDVDSRQTNATDCEAGEVLKAREQAGFLIYTPWATCLRMPKASRLVIRRLCFSMQFDGEKADKITGGACACNDDKVIFQNPLIYSAAVVRVPGMN